MGPRPTQSRDWLADARAAERVPKLGSWVVRSQVASLAGSSTLVNIFVVPACGLDELIGLHLDPRMPYPKGWPDVGPKGPNRCSEFVCQSCQKLCFCAVFANRANLRINNLCGIR